jgi:PAT family beta-lactamase induction signal transducer AmpG
MPSDPHRPPALRRTASMFTLGFASGLPYQLIRDVPKGWLAGLHVSNADIGSLGWLSLPASVKFLWAPLLDRYVPPLLGRRRGWMVLFQIALAISILAMGLTRGHLGPILVVGTFIAFFSASQDVVADAYRTDVLPPDERATGTSYWVVSFKLATILLGGGLLYLVGLFHLPWPTAFAIAAGAMALCVAATLAAPAEPPATHVPRTLRQAIVLPVIDLLSRRRIWVILLFVFLFKIPEMLASMFTLKFMRDIGYSLEQIGAVKNVAGIAVTVLGTLSGGWIARWMGTRQSLWVMGAVGAISNAGFVLLAVAGPRPGLMPVVVCTESFCAGLVTAAFVAFLMSLCNRDFSATHYAVLSGIAGLSESLLGRGAGAVADHVGWAVFFAISVTAGMPSLLLIAWLPESRGELRPSNDLRTGPK